MELFYFCSEGLHSGKGQRARHVSRFAFFHEQSFNKAPSCLPILQRRRRWGQRKIEFQKWNDDVTFDKYVTLNGL